MSGWAALGQGIGMAVDDWIINPANKRRERKLYKRDRRHLEAREDSTIQRRVEVARLAGLHPLFAMGASPSSGVAPMVSEHTGPSNRGERAGRLIGSSIPTAESELAKENAEELREAQLDVLRSEAERNRSDAVLNAARASETARVVQRSNVTQDGVIKSGLAAEGRGDVLSGPLGKVKIDPKHSDADDWQRRHGDIAENIEGSVLYVKEKGQAIAERYQQELDSLLDWVDRLYPFSGKYNTSWPSNSGKRR